MKRIGLYLVALVLIVIIGQVILPGTSWFGQTRPKPEQTNRTTLQLTEAQVKQFDHEDRIGVSYEMAGLSLQTLAVKRMDTVRQTPLLLVEVEKEKILQVSGEPNRLLAITVNIKNQSNDSIEIGPKLGQYEANGQSVSITDPASALNGTYKQGEERSGIVFVPTTEKTIPSGRLTVRYETAAGQKELRIALN